MANEDVKTISTDRCSVAQGTEGNKKRLFSKETHLCGGFSRGYGCSLGRNVALVCRALYLTECCLTEYCLFWMNRGLRDTVWVTRLGIYERSAQSPAAAPFSMEDSMFSRLKSCAEIT